MRVSAEEKARSRARIVDAASRIFRENGIGATGVAEIMQAADMTHGGFYRHFRSKEELAGVAIACASKAQLTTLDAAIEAHGAKDAVRDFLAEYLSPEHVQNPGLGCPLTSLSAEAARTGGPAVEQIETARQALVARIALALPSPPEAARARASAMLSTMVGAVVLARLARNVEDRDTILRDARAAVDAQI